MKKRVYLLLELKRIFKSSLRTLAGAAVLAVIVGAVAFCAQKVFYGDALMEKIPIGIVVEGVQNEAKSQAQPDGILGMALDFLESMESVASSCEFIYMDEIQAQEALKTASVTAVMMVPESLVGDIISGQNTPVRILFSRADALSAAMLKMLTEAGARTLGSAQAGIYAAYDLYVENGCEARLQDAYDVLNGYYLKLALARASSFDHTEVSATGKMDALHFYGSGAVVFLLMLLGMGLAPAICTESLAFLKKLKIYGVYGWKYVGVKFAALWVVAGLLTLLAVSGLILWNGGFVGDLPGAIPGTLLMGAVIASLWTLLVVMMPTAAGGILAIFAVATGLMVISGGLIPAAFLPEVLGSVGRWLPAGLMVHFLHGLMQGQLFFGDMGAMSAYIAVFLISAVLLLQRKLKERPEIEGAAAADLSAAKGADACKEFSRKMNLQEEIGARMAGPKVRCFLGSAFKRLFKYPAFLFFLILFPALVVGFGRGTAADSGAVDIALYLEDEDDEFCRSVVEKLMEEQGILNFYLCEDRKTLENDVAAMRAECGYVLPKHLLERLLAGESRKLMETVNAPSTVASRLVDEVVFSHVFEAFSPYIFVGGLTQKALPKLSWPFDSTNMDAVGKLLAGYMEKGQTFAFEFNAETENTYRRSGIFADYLEGLMAVFVFVCALLGTMQSMKDQQKGIYVRLGYFGAAWAPLTMIFASAALGGAVAAVGLWILEGFLAGTAITMGAYVFFLCGYCRCLMAVFSREQTFTMAIPVLILCSLAGVVMSSGTFLLPPAVSLVSRLFPIRWFLEASAWAPGIMICGGLLFGSFGFLLERFVKMRKV